HTVWQARVPTGGSQIGGTLGRPWHLHGMGSDVRWCGPLPREVAMNRCPWGVRRGCRADRSREREMMAPRARQGVPGARAVSRAPRRTCAWAWSLWLGVAGCSPSAPPTVDVGVVRTAGLALRPATAAEEAALRACTTWLPAAGLGALRLPLLVT